MNIRRLLLPCMLTAMLLCAFTGLNSASATPFAMVNAPQSSITDYGNTNWWHHHHRHHHHHSGVVVGIHL